MEQRFFKFSQNLEAATEKVFEFYTPGIVFTTFHFLHNLGHMGPISLSVTLH
jgi:hypothetical protein